MTLKKKERKKIVSVKANIIVTLLCNSKSYFLHKTNAFKRLSVYVVAHTIYKSITL